VGEVSACGARICAEQAVSGDNTLPRRPAGCSLAALLPVALALQLGGAGAGFRDSQQTRWGERRETMAGAEPERTAPLFFKAAVPNPVRVVPSFLGEGRWPARFLQMRQTTTGAHPRPGAPFLPL
jgi:hypothetical protein